MELVREKPRNKRKNKGAAPEEKFNRAWRRVQNQQKKNKHFLDDLEIVFGFDD